MKPHPESWADLRRIRGALLATTCFAVAGIALTSPVAAAPSGLTVGSGQVTVSNPNAQTTLIQQSTGKAILNWNSFSVGSAETVRFQQPNALSVALNRVTGSQPSSIFGHLVSNGQVFLLNPNGILFGRNSAVNVAGLVATTSGIKDSDFLAGNYNFNIASPNANAGVVNYGSITAADGGSVVLSGNYVQNDGLIQARLGKVVLAGTTTFAVDFAGDNLLSFAVTGPVNQVPVDQNGNPVIALVSNTGSIMAEGGKVTLTARAAKGILDSVINTTGMIEANTASMINGTVVLDAGDGGVTVGGGVSVTGLNPGETGGTIKVLGGAVAIAAGAMINASGDSGGGNIAIGGEFHGAGPDANAWTTNVQQGATIRADAVTYGNGGNVAVWADGYTAFNGSISAQGGALGGNGGFVETSGKQFLSVGTGMVNTLAPHGVVGNWLLDPMNITVVASGGANSLAQESSFTSDAGQSDTINASLINGATSNVTLQATNNITFNSAVSMSNNGVGITAQAGNNIAVNASITTRGGSLELDANDNSGGTATGSGAISIASGANLSTTGGSQTGGAITLKVHGGTGSIIDASTSTSSIVTTGGAVLIQTTGTNAGTGNVSIAGEIGTVGTSSVTSGSVTINAGGSVTVGSGLILTTIYSGNELSANETSINARGFNTSTTSQTPGNGGNITISGTSISLPFGASVRGGDSVNENTSGSGPVGWTGSGAALTANGANAGTMTLTATGGSVTVGNSATTGDIVGLFARGGESTGGAAGNGGTITVNANTISLARADAKGGDTLAASAAGGRGGTVQLIATAASGPAVTIYGESDSPVTTSSATLSSLSARGGYSGLSQFGVLSPGTLTGAGGTVLIASTTGGTALNGSSYVQLATGSGPNGGSTIGLSAGGGLGSSGVISVNGPINATTANVESMRITISDGSASFGGSVGGAVALNSITLGSGFNSLPSGGTSGAVTFQGPVTVGTQIQDFRSSGSLTFGGLLTTPLLQNNSTSTPASLALNGGGVFTGDIKTANANTITLGGNFVFTGSFTGNLNGGFSPPFVLSGPASFDSSALNVPVGISSITGSFPLTINTGKGNLTIGSISGVRLALRGSGTDRITGASGTTIDYAGLGAGAKVFVNGSQTFPVTSGPAKGAIAAAIHPVVTHSAATSPAGPVATGRTEIVRVSAGERAPTPSRSQPAESDNAPSTVEGTDTGGTMFAEISGGSGASAGGRDRSSGSTSSGSSRGGGSQNATGGSRAGSGSTTTASTAPGQTQDSGDRAMSVIAQPPPLQPVSHAAPLPPRVTAPVVPGFVSQVQHPVVPKSGTPGVQQSFSASGNTGRW